MAEIAKLVPRIRFNVKSKYRKISMVGIDSPIGRLYNLRRVLQGLLKYERIEVNYHMCDEVRGYAERLICDAIRHGDKHPPTMEMADFWLEDKQMLHKLFKVLVPRYQNYKTTVTDLHLIPIRCNFAMNSYLFQQLCVLELKGNPYPKMPEKPKPNSASLTNILLKEAGKDFRKMKVKSDS